MASWLNAAIARAIERTGTPWFTRRQLYYETCRVLLPRPTLRRLRFTMPAPVRYATFEAALGDVPGLVAQRPGFPVEPTEPDLYDYGLPRLLVCQDADIAAMLLANDLHLEAACPVVSVADLPLDARLVAALRLAGNPTVYLLHDASAAGMAVPQAIRASLPDIRVRMLGLRPAHASSMHLTRVPGPAAVQTVSGLRPWENRWLAAGRVAEVAAINPARLVRTLHRLVRDHRRGTHRAAVAAGQAILRGGVRQVAESGFMSWPTGGQAA